MAAFCEGCAARGMRTVSVWGEEIDRIGEPLAKRVLEDNGLSVFGYNRAGPLLAGTAEGRRAFADAGRRAIDQAHAFGADHVLVFPGGLPGGSRDIDGARTQTEEAIAGLLDHARGSGIQLALEPLHPMLAGDRSCILTLAHANAICDRLGAGIGIVVDVYHVWWDERLGEEIARTGAAGRILGFHVNDWLVPTKHILTDRGMMGDGIIDLAGLWRKVQAAGYRGPIEVEIFSEDWWARDPDEVLDTAVARCETIFGPVKVAS
ncbi:MAG: sugar phosphate isomerase/epimerase [Rhodobiaceae bacterium]|nr:sugar phosphate isomerase/epimerase [Rhodobiaceae bacterium]